MSENTMKTFDVSLSGDLLAWAEAEAEQGPHEDVQAYLRALVEKDLAETRRLLEEGRASGLSGKDFKQVLADIKGRWSNEAA